MQRDSSTYCDEPEDEDDFAAWLKEFDLEKQKPAIAKLIAENTFMSELQVGGARLGNEAESLAAAPDENKSRASLPCRRASCR